MLARARTHGRLARAYDWPVPRSSVLAAATLLLTIGCGPDIHIHIHNYPDGTATDADLDTAAEGTGGGTQQADGSPPQTSGPPPATSGPPPATSGDPTTGADAAETGPPPGEDPYPAPAGGVCPDGWRYSTPLAGFEFCAPPCPCPAPAEGDAAGACAFNPDSSNTACTPGDGTCMGGETCTTLPDGSDGCALAPSHCALTCSGGQTCPTGMVCTGIGACLYPM